MASQGETREEALNNIKEAIEGYLEVKAELLSRKIKGERVEVVVKAPYTPMTKTRNKPRLLRRGKVKQGLKILDTLKYYRTKINKTCEISM